MRIKEKEVTLKNGRKVILRSPDTADAEAVIQHFSITSGETYFMARYPEEIVITVEEEKEFLRKLNEDEDNFMIAAFLDGQLVGNAGVLKIQDFIKLRHRGGFGISIRDWAPSCFWKSLNKPNTPDLNSWSWKYLPTTKERNIYMKTWGFSR